MVLLLTHWKGEIVKEDETLIFMKTTGDKFSAIEAYFMQHSGYEIPELIALKPEQVNQSYINWVVEETTT